MQTHILTEGSNTTADDLDTTVSEYYGGLFSTVSDLYNELSGLSETHLHVLSEKYGVVKGEEEMATVYENVQTPVGSDEMAERAKSELFNAAADADIMIILLSADVFEKIVGEIRVDLVDAAKPGSIWCLGVARKSLDSLDFEGLKAKECTVLTYQRVGVARIGSETREELIKTIKQKTTQ